MKAWVSNLCAVHVYPANLGANDTHLSLLQHPAQPSLKRRLVQGLLCGVLQVIIQKLAEQDTTKVTVMQYADQIMEALLRVFSSRHATVHEEAMLAVGALTYACGPQFSKYMQSFYPVLEMGLQQHLVSCSLCGCAHACASSAAHMHSTPLCLQNINNRRFEIQPGAPTSATETFAVTSAVPTSECQRLHLGRACG